MQVHTAKYTVYRK